MIETCLLVSLAHLFAFNPQQGKGAVGTRVDAVFVLFWKVTGVFISASICVATDPCLYIS